MAGGAQTITELLVSIGVEVKDAEKAEKKVKAVKDKVEDVGEEAKETAAKTKLWGRVTKQVSDGIKRDIKEGAERSWKDLHKTIAGVVTAVAAAATAAAVGIFTFVNSQTQAIDANNKLAASLGMSVEELQRLQFAASQSGLDAEKFRAAILKVNAAVLAGTGPAVDELEKMGIAVASLEGRSATEQLGMIGDALNRFEDDAMKSATSALIFGEEAGPAMASLLAEGSEGIRELAAQAEGVLSQEDADRATAFQDRMGELRGEFNAVTQSLAVELIPTIYDVVVGFRDWVNANREFIQQNVKGAISATAEVLAEVGKAVTAVVKAVQWMIGVWNSLKETLGPVGAVLDWIADYFVKLYFPITSIIDAVNSLAEAFYNLGLASRTATAGMGSAVSGAAKAIIDANERELIRRGGAGAVPVRPFIEAFPADPDSIPDMLRRPDVDPVQRRAGGGGGKRETPKRELPPGVTVDEVIRQMRAGNLDVLREQLRGIEPSTPSVADVKPTVAITMNHIEVEQNITTSDPVVAGRESAQHVVRLLQDATAKAAAYVGSRVVG